MKPLQLFILIVCCLFNIYIASTEVKAQDFKNQRFDRQRVVRPQGSVPCIQKDSVILPKIYSVLFDFNSDSLVFTGVDTLPPDYNEFFQVAQISDKNGVLAARYTGRYLNDRYGNVIDLNQYFINDNGLRQYAIDNSMILPHPGKDDHFILIFLTNFQYDNSVFYRMPHSFSVLYFHLDDLGLINIDSIGQDLKTDPYLFNGGISACRHANGRDWWIMSPIRRSSEVNTFLVDTSGVHFIKKQLYGNLFLTPKTTTRFSTKGNYFLIGEEENYVPPQMYLKKVHLQIVRFDRCDGSLFDQLDFYLPPEDTNCATTPFTDLNERYIYVATCNAIWQGDLWSNDVPNSFIKVCERDISIEDANGYHPIGTGFHGADGKLYFLDFNNNYGMTVINYPERGGLACDARYAGIIKPGCTGASTGNMPYYGLGPLDGSPCDTLGLDGPLSKKPEQAHNPPIMVSPNPGTGIFFVQLPSQGGLLSVYNLNGMLIHSERISDFQMVAEINLAAGVYIVQFLSQDGSIRSGAKVVSR